MAVNVERLINENPDKVVITLTGNIHNALDTIFGNFKTMGFYLSQKYSTTELTSVNISWNTCTAYCSMDGELRVHVLFSKNSKCKEYFQCNTFLYKETQTNKAYPYFLFSDLVSASMPFVYK